MDKLLVSWSGGKDSALMLHELQQTRRYEIAALLTTVTADYDRVSMHGVPSEWPSRERWRTAGAAGAASGRAGAGA